MARITFPEKVDSFTEHYDPSPEQAKKLLRWQTLKAKENRTASEEDEYKSLSEELKPFIFSAEDLNKMQDAIVGMEEFFLKKTLTQISEWKSSLEQKMGSVISLIEGKKDEYVAELTRVFNDAKRDVQSIINSFNQTVSVSKNEVVETKDEATRQLNNTKNETVTAIAESERATKNAITKTKDEAVSTIDTTKTSAVNTINNTKTQAENNLQALGDAFLYLGEWNQNVAYKKNNIVRFGKNVYLAIEDSNNATPSSNGAKWRLAVSDGQDGSTGPQGERGQKGDPGIGTLYRGIYNHGEQYNQNDMVTFRGELYCYTSPTSASGIYPTDSSKWDLLVAKGKSIEKNVLENTLQANQGATTVPIGINEFMVETDRLSVYVNGKYVNSKDYTKRQSEVVFKKALSETSTITFVVERNVMTDRNYARHVKRSVRLNVGSWSNVSGVPEVYSEVKTGYCCKIEDSDFNGAVDVDVVFDAESLPKAISMGISGVALLKNNKLYLLANKNTGDTSTLVADLVIWNNSR